MNEDEEFSLNYIERRSQWVTHFSVILM